MRTADGLSQKQQNILTFIEDFVQKHGYSPSIRDIQSGLEISSTSVVAYNLNILRNKGKLNRDSKVSRGITLTNQPIVPANRASVLVPLLGTITAGGPLPDPEDTSTSVNEMVEVPTDVASEEKLSDVYALRVRGHSMIDALIDDDDIVLLHFQETAENGQMVAALLIEENAVTLKKFYHEGHRIRLQPANVTMDPIFTAPDNVRIQGRVVGVLRSMV